MCCFLKPLARFFSAWTKRCQPGSPPPCRVHVERPLMTYCCPSRTAEVGHYLSVILTTYTGKIRRKRYSERMQTGDQVGYEFAGTLARRDQCPEHGNPPSCRSHRSDLAPLSGSITSANTQERWRVGHEMSAIYIKRLRWKLLCSEGQYNGKIRS